jgi:hypothetical protein
LCHKRVRVCLASASQETAAIVVSVHSALSDAMNEALKRLVWDRVENTCEYCRLPQSLDVLPFQIDHIIAEPLHDSGQVSRNRPALVRAEFPSNPAA